MPSNVTTPLATRVENDLARAYETAAAEQSVTRAQMVKQALVYYKQKNPDSIRAFDDPHPLESLKAFSEDLVR